MTSRRCPAEDGVVPANAPLPALVVNVARVHDLRRLRHACDEAAAAAGWRPPLVLPTTPDDAGREMTERALDAGASLVIAAGGDGTVRACAQALADTLVPLAIVPAGAANLTATALGLPMRTAAALRVAFTGHDRQIDLAEADGLLFSAMAGIGLDAAVVGATPPAVKRLAGWTAYAAAATTQLQWRPATFAIQLDGVSIVRQAQSVTVGNSGALPGGFPIVPAARLDDGLLDVVVLAPASVVGWADVGLRVLVRSRREDARLARYQARRVEISTESELPRQVDGEILAPGKSLTVVVRPAALRVRVR
jgi:YegS/Rv2252/BmrU family lipid kinase